MRAPENVNFATSIFAFLLKDGHQYLFKAITLVTSTNVKVFGMLLFCVSGRNRERDRPLPIDTRSRASLKS